MDINIVFKISKDTIIISEIKKDVDYKSLNNTNVIDLKELKFSVAYIQENFELVSNFLNLVVIKKNISKAQINNMDIALISLNLINEWHLIKTIIFKPNQKINMELFLKLLDNKNINEIDCFDMPSYLIERLDTNTNIKVNIRNEITSKTKFMILNSLETYTDIYYKKVLVLSGEFDEADLQEFKTFMRINAKIKYIKIVNYSNELITTIISEIIENKKENILIEINEKNNDLDAIYNAVNHLKKSYNKYFENANIKFKLNYSTEYKNNNFFKEINFKLFTSIIFGLIILSSSVIGINYYQQYKDRNKIIEQLQEIDQLISLDDTNFTIDDNESDIEYIEADPAEETTTTTTAAQAPKSNYVSPYYTNYEQVFDKLLNKNNDTVGWLTVNNTQINYPVVQAENNSFYLNNDFNKNKNSMGWIFMDYRNDAVNLNKNTIIYGHNIKTGIMFGTIKKMMASSWYNNAANQIITFNTPTKNMKWKIFSLYKVPSTEDYLVTDFIDDQEYLDFINMIKARSLKDFGVEVNANSKILTLSTCYNHVNRHVVHAVLIEE